MTSEMIVLLPFVFLFGITVGSFLNVCIYRLPLGEDLVKTNSHCMTCGSQIRWYDLIPVFSWLVLGGRCRHCKSPISIQYPCIELFNGILWTVIVYKYGFQPISLWYAGAVSALLVLSLIDWRTFEIPFSCCVWIGMMGMGNLITECMSDGFSKAPEFLTGAVLVSGFLEFLYVVSKGRAIGGGDIKLMFAAGLLLGWKGILWAFVLGCICGSIVQPILIKWKQKKRVLAFGPYLSVGIWIAMMWGQELSRWYLSYLKM